MGKIKCPECHSCMDYVWVDNIRFLSCWLCRTWYAGSAGEIHLVRSPYLIDCPNCSGEGITHIFHYEMCDMCKGTRKVDRRLLENAG